MDQRNENCEYFCDFQMIYKAAFGCSCVVNKACVLSSYDVNKQHNNSQLEFFSCTVTYNAGINAS